MRFQNIRIIFLSVYLIFATVGVWSSVSAYTMDDNSTLFLDNGENFEDDSSEVVLPERGVFERLKENNDTSFPDNSK